MSFQQGLSGLSAASTSLDTIGNNIANSGTVGFKSGQAQFADVYANSLNNATGSKTGIGTKVSAIMQQFTQGNITTTQNPLDVAINGNGFFRMSNDGAVTYSRNGQFHLSKDGYIVNADESCRLTGYAADANGVLATGSVVEMNINTSDLAPKATTEVTNVMNLNSGASAVDQTTYPFDPDDPNSYTSSTSITVYDSLGNSHVLQTYYVKTATNTWEVYGVTNPSTSPVGTTDLGKLAFTTSGTIDTTNSSALPLNVHMTVGTGAVTTLDFNMDFAGTSQYGSTFSVNSATQDGYESGRLSNFSVAGDGTLVGNYTNGKTAVLGQVVLANFSNPNGLQPLGNNQWAETAPSGAALIGTPDSSSLGVLQSYAVEDSNVDLTEELVSMITAQRSYQANAQTIKTQDEVMQTLVNL